MLYYNHKRKGDKQMTLYEIIVLVGTYILLGVVAYAIIHIAD